MQIPNQILTTRREGAVLVVTVHRCVEVDEEPELRRIASGVCELLMGTGVQHVLIDLRETPYAASSLLGAITRWWKIVSPRQGRVALCHVSPTVRETLARTKLDRFWSVFDSPEDAVLGLREN